MFCFDKMKKIESLANRKKALKLASFLSDRKMDVRVAAIKALGNINNEDAYNALVTTLRDPDPAIRIHVIEALGNSHDSRIIEHVRYLGDNDSDESVRKRAVEVSKRMTVS